MQSRYAGDIGDFGKYGLLRSLARGTELSLGVCWYLHPDEDQRNDCSHTQCLQQTRDNRIRFRALDPEIYDRLARMVQEDNRSIALVQDAGILPEGTRFFGETLRIPPGTPARGEPGPGNPGERTGSTGPRKHWPRPRPSSWTRTTRCPGHWGQGTGTAPRTASPTTSCPSWRGSRPSWSTTTWEEEGPPGSNWSSDRIEFLRGPW